MDRKKYVKDNEAEIYALLKEMCAIPAPSGKEDARARYCADKLMAWGAEGVYIDSAKNVICPYGNTADGGLVVLAAHTDTVFPDMEPMPYKEENGKIFCPGVGDDTASAVVLMETVKYFLQNKIQTEKGILFVLNSSEEGLGNLAGTKQLFKDFEGRIEAFISLDSLLGTVHHDCVGSHRYRVTVRTEGGHSFCNFGNRSAIAALAEIISEIYKIVPPAENGYKTTYNVGTIEGGTSVNTIAQEASMLCEYRADRREDMAVMEEKYNKIFAEAAQNADISVTRVGDRPCAAIDPEKQAALVEMCRETAKKYAPGGIVNLESASTDCNIPLSLGIPAVAVGVFEGGGAHTREEWIDRESLKKGMEYALELCEKLSGVQGA